MNPQKQRALPGQNDETEGLFGVGGENRHHRLLLSVGTLRKTGLVKTIPERTTLTTSYLGQISVGYSDWDCPHVHISGVEIAHPHGAVPTQSVHPIA